AIPPRFRGGWIARRRSRARDGWGRSFVAHAHPTRRLSAPPSPKTGRDAVARSCAIKRDHQIHISNNRRAKNQSSAAPVLARRGERRDFHPLGSRGECSLTNVRGSGAPKG